MWEEKKHGGNKDYYPNAYRQSSKGGIIKLQRNGKSKAPPREKEKQPISILIEQEVVVQTGGKKIVKIVQ